MATKTEGEREFRIRPRRPRTPHENEAFPWSPGMRTVARYARSSRRRQKRRSHSHSGGGRWQFKWRWALLEGNPPRNSRLALIETMGWGAAGEAALRFHPIEGFLAPRKTHTRPPIMVISSASAGHSLAVKRPPRRRRRQQFKPAQKASIFTHRRHRGTVASRHTVLVLPLYRPWKMGGRFSASALHASMKSSLP